MMNGEFLAYPLIFIIFIVLVVKLREYAKELQEKHLKLMQFYLDRKLIYNIVTNGFKSESKRQYDFEFIRKIKEYFQLEEVRIIKYNSLKNDDNLAPIFKETLENIISNYSAEKNSDSDDSYIILDPVEIANHNYRLYIYFPCKKSAGKNHDENIICIKKNINNFSNDEIFTLDTCIHIFKKIFPI
ncbi:hypothetical protein [Rickettsia endosymbiont of Halotydeus destructor]|uniref:hypothetical protein n=1 Tax=Rickettsia endosymbiont of Halotydeus destructor TaxID=2996754 RepID=UPI003BAFC969